MLQRSSKRLQLLWVLSLLHSGLAGYEVVDLATRQGHNYDQTKYLKCRLRIIYTLFQSCSKKMLNYWDADVITET